MNNYTSKDVATVLFPAPNPDATPKKRPALVLRKTGNEDLLLCMMTTVKRGEPEEVFIRAGEANLKKDTYVRTHKIMTVHESFISINIGKISEDTWKTVISTIKNWLK